MTKRIYLYIIIIITIFIISSLGVFIGIKNGLILNKQKSDAIYCTQDVKQCPDGSSVGRVPPSCEFASCPISNTGIDKGQGTISGKVTIGPLCPVEPCPTSVQNPYTSRELILTTSNSSPVSIKLNPDGSIPPTQVETGTYTIILTRCEFLGCNRALPKTISVEATKTTEVQISIDTGIR